MSKKWTKALMALGFSLFLVISACDQGGGGGEERGGSPGVSPGQSTDRPSTGPSVQEPRPGTQGQQPGATEERPEDATRQRQGATGQEPSGGGPGAGTPTAPQSPPAS